MFLLIETRKDTIGIFLNEEGVGVVERGMRLKQ
jgi:hypothetical protein